MMSFYVMCIACVCDMAYGSKGRDGQLTWTRAGGSGGKLERQGAPVPE